MTYNKSDLQSCYEERFNMIYMLLQGKQEMHKNKNNRNNRKMLTLSFQLENRSNFNIFNTMHRIL